VGVFDENAKLLFILSKDTLGAMASKFPWDED